MATPIYILLALTEEGMRRFWSDRAGPVARLGLDRHNLSALEKALARHGLVVMGEEVVPLGPEGWDRGRRQYRTKALLRRAREKARSIPDWHVKVLLITDADMFDAGTVFVAGQAEVDGRAAVVSVARLGAGDEAKFLRRVLKEALHELGHTLGLGHCNDHDCVMFQSRVLADSDVKAHDLCDRCRVKAGRALRVERA